MLALFRPRVHNDPGPKRSVGQYEVFESHVDGIVIVVAVSFMKPMRLRQPYSVPTLLYGSTTPRQHYCMAALLRANTTLWQHYSVPTLLYGSTTPCQHYCMAALFSAGAEGQCQHHFNAGTIPCWCCHSGSVPALFRPNTLWCQNVLRVQQRWRLAVDVCKGHRVGACTYVRMHSADA